MDPDGLQDNLDYNSYVIDDPADTGGAIDLTNTNLARITLHQVKLATTPLGPSCPMRRGLPRSSGQSRCSTAAKKASMSRCRIEWHQDELFPRIGFIVTNLGGGAAPVTWFYNGRGTAEVHQPYCLHCHRFYDSTGRGLGRVRSAA
jgi:hypothetical protein